MEWLKIITVLLANIGFLFWAISESRQDQKETREMIRAIEKEGRDFNARMREIEERRKGK